MKFTDIIKHPIESTKYFFYGTLYPAFLKLSAKVSPKLYLLLYKREVNKVISNATLWDVKYEESEANSEVKLEIRKHLRWLKVDINQIESFLDGGYVDINETLDDIFKRVKQLEECLWLLPVATELHEVLKMYTINDNGEIVVDKKINEQD